MRIERIEHSLEECQQAGWLGYDIFLDAPIDEATILSWQALGDLVYLPQLRQPFFRVAGRSFLLKGLLGQNKIRLGMEQGFLNVADKTTVSEFLKL